MRAEAEEREPVEGEGALGAIVRLEQYPIHRPASPEYERLVKAARASLNSSGAFVLEGFLLPQAVAAILDQSDSMAEAAFVSSQPHNVFLVPGDPAFPADHARNRFLPLP